MTIFSKIINKEIPADILFEDENVIAFYDINPERKGHFLVVPKTFSTNLTDIEDKELANLMIVAKKLANEEIKKLGVSGFNIKINNGKEAGQEVFHTHVHVIPTIK